MLGINKIYSYNINTIKHLEKIYETLSGTVLGVSETPSWKGHMMVL